MRRNHWLASAIVLALGLAGPGWSQEKPDRAEKGPSEASVDAVELGDRLGEGKLVDAGDVLSAWSKKLGSDLVLDPALEKVKLPAPDAKTTWAVAKRTFDFHDIVIEERRAGDRWVMYAHWRKNLAQRSAPPYRVVSLDELPKREEIVTCFIPIQNGAGNDIFATVRGLLVRDVNRIGNILYVRGPEVIILVDFAANVEYYAKVIKRLDAASVRPVTRVFQVSADAEAIARTVRSTFSPPRVENGVVVAGTVSAPVEVQTHSSYRLVVRTTPEQMNDVAELVKQLDARPEPK